MATNFHPEVNIAFYAKVVLATNKYCASELNRTLLLAQQFQLSKTNGFFFCEITKLQKQSDH